jgi:hypothetical protein
VDEGVANPCEGTEAIYELDDVGIKEFRFEEGGESMKAGRGDGAERRGSGKGVVKV